jgi:adenosine deaminase
MRDPRTLPKAELHLHLEGAMRVERVRELAERDGLPLPHGLGENGWRFTDGMDFLDNYVELCALMTRLDDFRQLGLDVCEDLAATGVPYAEAVFSPSNHAPGFDGDHRGPIEAVLDGLQAGRERHGVEVQLTPDLIRDLGTDEAERVLEVALAYRGKGVIGLNAAGSERSDLVAFAPVVRRAKDAGLRIVPHAGEWAGPRNVWDTLEHYLPDRIGHGVRSIEDPALVERLADLAIPLEVSPLSNVATGVAPDLRRHPFVPLREAGVVVTLNSDDPPMFGGWLSDVYSAARDAWGLTDEDLAKIARTSVPASFADDGMKKRLLAGIDAWLAAPA